MNRRKTLVGAACLIGQPLLLNALSIPAIAYLIRSLGPEGYGQWMAAMALVALFGVLANLGLRTLYVRELSRHPEEVDHIFAEQLGLRLVLSILAGAVAVIAGTLLGYPPIVLICILLAALGQSLTCVSQVAADTLQALGKLTPVAGVNLVAGLALTAASVATVLLGGGAVEVTAAYLLGPVIAAALSLRLLAKDQVTIRVCWSLTRGARRLRESAPLVVEALAATLGTQAESVVIPKLLGLSSFGYFSAGSLPVTRLRIVSEGLGTAFFPILSRLYLSDRTRIARVVLGFLMLALGACSGVAIGVTFLAPWIAEILFPAAPETGCYIIQTTIWTLPLLAVCQVMSVTLNAADRQRQVAVSTIASVLIGLPASVLLIRWFGIQGACWSRYSFLVVAAVVRLPAFLDVARPFREAHAPVAARLEVSET